MFYDIQYKSSGNLIQICPVDFVLTSGPHNENNTFTYLSFRIHLNFYYYVPKLLGKLRQA